MSPPKVATFFGSHQPTSGETTNRSKAPNMVAPKRMLQNFCTNRLLPRERMFFLLLQFQGNSILVEHLRIRQDLQEVDDIPDFLRLQIIFRGRHGYAVDSRR